MYKIGDEVIIFDWGRTYANAMKCAKRLGSTKYVVKDLFYWDYINLPKRKGIIKNLDRNMDMYLIDVGEEEFLVAKEGFKLYKKNIKPFGIVNFCKEMYK